MRVVPQTESRSDWFEAHKLTNFLPPQSMLPLSSESGVMIPDFTPIPIKTQKEETRQDERFISNLCLQQPYLFECKRPKLKNKIDLKIKR
jgi:hypothetical protein